MADEKTERKPLLQFEGIYVGKEARRKQIIKTGANAGKESITYGLKIKAKESDQFGKSFTATNNTKGIETIKELDWVKVGYILDEYINKDGLAVTSHKVMWIGKSSQVALKETKAVEMLSKELGKIDLSKFDAFKVKYLVALKEKGITPNFVHMTGSFLASSEKERTKELVEKCKEALEAEKPPKV